MFFGTCVTLFFRKEWTAYKLALCMSGFDVALRGRATYIHIKWGEAYIIVKHKMYAPFPDILKRYRPVPRYGLSPPPRGNFVDHNFLEASCLASFLQHVSPLAMEALPINSPLHMLPMQRHKFNIKRTEVRIHINICRCSIKCYFIL